MKNILLCLLILWLFTIQTVAQTGKSMKVMISVDMEGMAGIVNFEEVAIGGLDYQYFRNLLAEEVNAAIEGAFLAGATEVVVRDAHKSARNILPGKLDERAVLLRDWSEGPMMMVEGIDETFDALLFIGYHAKNGTPNAVMDHMYSQTMTDCLINGISVSEAAINGLFAGYFNVPVVFLSGDKAICEKAKDVFENIETVCVKEGIGEAALCIHPKVAQRKIKQGVIKALEEIKSYKPLKLKAPYKLVVQRKSEVIVHRSSFFPNVKRTGDWEYTYESDDVFDLLNVFMHLRK